MKLRHHLSWLVIAAITPVLAVAIAASMQLVHDERAAVERDAVGRVRSAMSAVDAELRGSVATLEALAASRHIDARDLRAFYEEARRVLATQPRWQNIALSSPSKTHIFDAVLPFGQPAPFSGDADSIDRVLATGRAAIGDIADGADVRMPAIRVHVPVVRNGTLEYVLSAPLRLESLQTVLRAQQIPQDWVIVVVDRARRFIGRIPAMPPGTVASESFREALSHASEGFFRGRTVEGFETYTPYVTSALSGWVLGIAVPASVIEAAANRMFTIMTVGLTLGLMLALALALLVARRIAQPIAQLAAAANGLEEGAEVDGVEGIEEISQVRHALRSAGHAIRERQVLVEREKSALRAADKAKDEFIAMLSHELRNPLSALTSAARLLKTPNATADMRDRARDVIERQTGHMARLIEDLLDVSRILMGKAPFEREPVDLEDLVRAAMESWRAAGRFERHKVSMDLESVWVNADRARLEQILSNLVDNALKFTPAGKAISVHLRRENDDAQLSVSDQGEGLAPGAAGRIFDLFVQGERALDRSKGGMGIGLALVKRLVEMHGGSVSAHSTGPGQGAEFSVRLPAIALPRLETRAVERRKDRPRRVLIVEDNADAREMLRALLAIHGHAVQDTASGAAALAAAADAWPDVVLVDIGLPDIDGYELAGRLRAAAGGRNVLLVAVTGYGQPADKARAMAAGFDAHLTKPVELERLQEMLASAPAVVAI
jgi:signal transduction histidine kinase/ActR/RegA family two-component response regulator